MNGDGLADAVAFDAAGVWVSPSSGLGFLPAVKWADPMCAPGQTCVLADVNGDGYADALAFVKSTRSGGDEGDVWVALSAGTAFAPAAKWSDWLCVGSQICAAGDVDGDGRADLAAFQPSGIGVGFAYTPPQVATPTFYLSQVGAVIIQSMSASGGVPPYTWSATGLPPGVHIDAQTGQVTGAPAFPGTFNVTITVNDASAFSRSASATASWTVVVAVPDIVGLGKSAAATALGAAGLSLGNERDLALGACDDRIGTVLDQTPAAGSTVTGGSVVNFSLGVRPSGTHVCD